MPDRSQPTLQPTADGCDTLYSDAYGQTFHSTHGALTEARHVFLDGTGVAERLAQRQATRLLEVGFGTGLNFLLTAREARATGTLLRYDALEHEVLPAAVLAQLNHGLHLGIEPLRDRLLAWRRSLPDPVPSGTYRHVLARTVTLSLVVGDATTIELPNQAYDAVYLDAFSPDANPELWTEAFFTRLHEALIPKGCVATYSARGSVRRALTAAGFIVEKRPGPPGKREMVVATR